MKLSSKAYFIDVKTRSFSTLMQNSPWWLF